MLNESQIKFEMVDFEGLTDTDTALKIMDKVREGGIDLKPIFRIVGYQTQYKNGMTKFIFKVMPKEDIKLDDIV